MPLEKACQLIHHERQKGLIRAAGIAADMESVSELWDSSATASWRSFFCVVGAKVGGWEQKMVPKASQRRKK
jgi:hypothetical protein